MKLKVTQTYYDKKESKYVDKDAIIERDDIRAKELMTAGVASVYVPEEPDATPQPEKKPESKSKKAAK